MDCASVTGMSTRDDAAGDGATSVLTPFRKTGHLAVPEVREMPKPPPRWLPLIGPGIIAAGVGLSSGEFVLFPFIASQVGLVFVWAAFVGVVTQYFVTMEIERYALATGETAVTGFSRFWPHWGLVFAILTYCANLWPGWATSSATLISFLTGGTPRYIAIGLLVAIGLVLTLAPVVYVALEKIQMVKVAAVLLLLVVGAFAAITATAWRAVPTIVTEASFPAAELGFATLFGALIFAGAGGGQNLVQSNWIRDKGFGMGTYVPRLQSPVTGEPEAVPSTGYVFTTEGPQGEENLRRWKGWWRFANVEQLSTFVAITVVSIFFTSLLAYSTVYGLEGLPNTIDFVRVEGEQLAEAVGGWFGVFFWIIGAFSLFGAALGITDYTSRMAADVLKTSYLKSADESRIYFWLTWGLVVIGCIVLLVGFDQPITLVVVSATVGGLMMTIYSALLIATNRKLLPAPLRVKGVRLALLVVAILVYGTATVLTMAQQLPKLFG